MNLETIFEKQLVNSNPLCDSVWFILVEDDVITKENSRVANHPVKNINSLEINGYEHRHTYCGHPFFYKVSL
jgi:hypothetical protein